MRLFFGLSHFLLHSRCERASHTGSVPKSAKVLFVGVALAVLMWPSLAGAVGTLLGPDKEGKYFYHVEGRIYTYAPADGGKWHIASNTGLAFVSEALTQQKLIANQKQLKEGDNPPQRSIEALEGLEAALYGTVAGQALAKTNPEQPSGAAEIQAREQQRLEEEKRAQAPKVPKISLDNPLEGKVSDLRQLLTSTVPNFLLAFIGLVALVLFFISAVRYLFNAGNQEATTEAKNGMLGAILGLVLALSAFGALAIIKRFIGS